MVSWEKWEVENWEEEDCIARRTVERVYHRVVPLAEGTKVGPELPGVSVFTSHAAVSRYLRHDEGRRSIAAVSFGWDQWVKIGGIVDYVF